MNAELKIAALADPDVRPLSAVSAMAGLAGLLGLLLWAAIARFRQYSGPHAALCSILACGGPMVLWSLFVDRVHRNPTTGIDWDSPPRPWPRSLGFSLVKIVGLWATWAGIAFLYAMARWYWENRFGDTLFSMRVLGYAAAPLLILSIPYLCWIDRRLKEPRDGAWHFGRLLIGQRLGGAEVDRAMVADHLRGWAIKAFFLAFMISIVPGSWAQAIAPPAASITVNIVALAHWLIAAMFMIDVSFATAGYVLTMKPLDAHIRSANPHAAAWTAALICYPPFIMMSPGGPLDYHPATADWVHWMNGSPLLLTGTAILLVLLTGIYAMATVAFGPRFSNLTHRGILTHGVYAWSKHPAYLSKNLFWWLSTLPFMATSHDIVDALRNTFLLAAVSAVYYWRARTEEKHLSADPAYRDYVRWMARNGTIPRLLRALRRADPMRIPAE